MSSKEHPVVGKRMPRIDSVAKATGDAAVARETVDHLRRYIELLFKEPSMERPEQ